MNATETARELRRVEKKYSDKFYGTGEVRICDMARDAAASIEQLQAENAEEYMRGVKYAIYEIFKEADIPGSQEIRDSGDSDDGMCAQAAELIKGEIETWEKSCETRDRMLGEKTAELSALREACRWIPTAERFPAIADADIFQDVEVLYSSGRMNVWYWGYVNTDNPQITHWRRTQLLPAFPVLEVSETLIVDHKCAECGFSGPVRMDGRKGRKVICPKCGTMNDVWLDGEQPPTNHATEAPGQEGGDR